MRLKTYAITLFFLQSCSPLLGLNPFTIFLDDSDKQEVATLALSVPLLPIKNIMCNANIEQDAKQVIELLGLKKDAPFDAAQFCKGVELLRHDKKLHRLCIKPFVEKNQLIIHVSVFSRWTVRHVSLTGHLPTKNQYRHSYGLHSGDSFEKSRYEEAIKTLVQALHDDGYMSAKVTATLSYKNTTREVDIALTVEVGERYAIDGVGIEGTFDNVAERFNIIKPEFLSLIEPALKNNFYSHALLEEQINTLYNYGYAMGFSEIEIIPQIVPDHSRKTIYVHLTLQLTNQRTYLFKGNTFFNQETLLKTVVFVGSSSFLMPPSAVAEEVETLYKNSGFLNVHVTWKEHKNNYHFTVKEGKRYRITGVVITGASYASSEQLVNSFFNPLINTAYYDARIADEAVKKCMQWYATEGFWDCAVADQTFTSTQHADEKIVSITIHEGKQRLLKQIILDAFPELVSDPIMQPSQPLEKPIPFDPVLLHKQRDFLAHYAQKKGNLYNSFQPDIHETEHDGVIIATVTWKRIGAEQPVVFDKTMITGSTVIAPDLIKQALAYKEGDVWNQEAIDRSVDQLKALNVFDSVSLEPADIFVPESSKAMIMRIMDDAKYEIRLRAGLGFVSKNFDLSGSGLTYRLGGSFVWKNPARYGDTLRFDTDFTRYRQEGAVEYAWPWWSHLPLKMNVKAYGIQCNQPFLIGTSDILYKATRLGFAGQINGTHNAFNWSCNSGFEWLKISGVSLKRAEALLFQPSMADRFVPYYLFEPTISFDHIDNKIQPKNGWQTTLSLRGMAPLNVRDAWFVRALAEQSFFTTPVSWLTLAFRLRGGTLFHADFEKIMPPERFYLGGSDSLRGYEQDMAPPLNLFRDGTETRLVPVGAKSMFNLNVEARFPIYGNFGGVVFNDMGILSQSYFTDVKAENILGSTGFGLRYNTPIGTARFDIGWKWKKRLEDDRSFAWFLTLGHSF